MSERDLMRRARLVTSPGLGAPFTPRREPAVLLEVVQRLAASDGQQQRRRKRRPKRSERPSAQPVRPPA
ncbi:MAG: hypothetical protein PVJ09_04690 [Candidatus Woesebacteria bacterium]